MANRLLRHIGQHRVSSTKCHHRHLTEEHRLLRIDVTSPKPAIETGNRRQPEHPADKRHKQSTMARRRGGGHAAVYGAAVVSLFMNILVSAVSLIRRQHIVGQKRHDRGADDHQRERSGEDKAGNKGASGNHHQEAFADYLLRQPPQRNGDNGKNSSLHPEKYRGHRH